MYCTLCSGVLKLSAHWFCTSSTLACLMLGLSLISGVLYASKYKDYLIRSKRTIIATNHTRARSPLIPILYLICYMYSKHLNIPRFHSNHFLAVSQFQNSYPCSDFGASAHHCNTELQSKPPHDCNKDNLCTSKLSYLPLHVSVQKVYRFSALFFPTLSTRLF